MEYRWVLSVQLFLGKSVHYGSDGRLGIEHQQTVALECELSIQLIFF